MIPARLQPDPSDDFFDGGLAMREEFDREPRRHRHRHRRRRRPDYDLGDLSDRESALRDARQMAERKTEIAGKALRFLGISLLLLIFVPPVGMIMLVVCGIKFGRQIYKLEVEPRLRERFVEQEVEKQVHASLSHQRRALEGEHARSLEQLSASIAHEIRNPITAAKSLVQQMGETPDAAENVEYAQIALDELRRVERSVSHLLRFAREEESERAVLHMADVVESALESFRERAERLGIRLERHFDCEGTMLGDAEQLRRVVINLVGNAMDAVDGAATADPRVEVHMGENLAGSEVWLQIRDNGPGIDGTARAKMWNPFFTSKVEGTGLGLAICRKIVEAHGGSIEVSSEPGDGAEFVLTFPKRAARGGIVS
jgi:signal transduction histidine kinase